MKAKYLSVVAAVFFLVGCANVPMVTPGAEIIAITRSVHDVRGAKYLGTTRIVLDTSGIHAEIRAKNFAYLMGGNAALIRIENWQGIYPLYAVDAFRM